MTPQRVAAIAKRMEEALSAYDVPAIDAAVDEMRAFVRSTDAGLDPDEVRKMLEALRAQRRFGHLGRLADALLESTSAEPYVRRQYAQSLIEQGYLFAALAVLRDVAGCGDESEQAEACGLMGRVFKELFLQSTAPERRAQFLRDAILAYRGAYEARPERTWHGINEVALLLRAARGGIDVGTAAAADVARKNARDVANTISPKIESDTASSWDVATAVETCLALDDVPGAVEAMHSLIVHPEAGAFHIGSLSRQLRDVWQLTPAAEPGSLLLPPLEAKLVDAVGGELHIDGDDVEALESSTRGNEEVFEKAFGPDGLETQRWFETLLARCRGIARIEDRFEEGIGTGFLVAGAELHVSYPEVVLVTNAHVVPDAVAPEEAWVTFRGLPGQEGWTRIGVTRMLWTSPKDKLDVSVIELESIPPNAAVCALANRFAYGSGEHMRVYIIGHPRATTLVKISIQDNLVLDADELRVHYRAPTEPGSSGSPVFDRKWNVIGVHHKGDRRMSRLHGQGTYEANEGIRFDRVKEALRRDLS